MSKAAVSSNPKDQLANERAYPQTDPGAPQMLDEWDPEAPQRKEAAASKMEEWVTVEFVEDKLVKVASHEPNSKLAIPEKQKEADPEKEASNPEKDVCKEVCIDEKKAKDGITEAIKASDSWEAEAVGSEKTSEGIPVEQVAEKKPEKTVKKTGEENPVKIIEVTKSRETLEFLMRKEKEGQDKAIEKKPSDSSVEYKYARQSTVTEDPEEAAEEVAPELKKAEDRLEQHEQRTEEDNMKKDSVCNEKLVEVEFASTDIGLPSENVIEKAKRETGVTNLAKNGETGKLGTNEEPKDSESIEEKNPGEPIKERQADMTVKTEEKIADCAEDTKDIQDQPNEDVAQPVQKQSANIVSKMKNSLRKAKKAILGNPQAIQSCDCILHCFRK